METTNEKKLFVIVHYVYEDLCGDSYYGKASKTISEDVVFDTETNVKDAVRVLNESNHSYYAHEPEDELDDDVWADYFYYKEINPISIAEVIKKRK